MQNVGFCFVISKFKQLPSLHEFSFFLMHLHSHMEQMITGHVSCHFVCILLQMMYNVVLTYLILFVSSVRLWALKNAQYIALAKILF